MLVNLQGVLGYMFHLFSTNNFVLEDGTIVPSEEDHVVLAIPSIPA